MQVADASRTAAHSLVILIFVLQWIFWKPRSFNSIKLTKTPNILTQRLIHRRFILSYEVSISYIDALATLMSCALNKIPRHSSRKVCEIYKVFGKIDCKIIVQELRDEHHYWLVFCFLALPRNSNARLKFAEVAAAQHVSKIYAHWKKVERMTSYVIYCQDPPEAIPGQTHHSGSSRDLVPVAQLGSTIVGDHFKIMHILQAIVLQDSLGRWKAFSTIVYCNPVRQIKTRKVGSSDSLELKLVSAERMAMIRKKGQVLMFFTFTLRFSFKSKL